jgi:hypothetical protein
LLMFASVLFAQNASLDCNDCFNGKRNRDLDTGHRTCEDTGKECMKK